ncbi:MAG: type II toxin-antitoxin system RelE family toxin [Gammaproteobacteria bacterium]
MDIYETVLAKSVIKDLKKLPKHIVINLHLWIANIKLHGLRKTQQILGYHDEPLLGKRAGQRSIRLNKSYRAIYIIDKNENVCFIEVLEVTKHEY